MMIKNEGQKEEKRDDRLRGRCKSQGNIQLTIDQYQEIERFERNNPEEFQKVEQRARTYLASRDSHFSPKRIGEKIDTFKRNMSKD